MISIAYYDEEVLFAERFCNFISEKPRLPFKIKRYTGFEELERHYMNGGSDVLLVSGKSMRKEMENYDTSHVIVLMDDEELQYEMSHPWIYKYQSVDSIINELLEIIAEDKEGFGVASICGKKAAEIIGVYSPVSRSGKTSFALTMAQLLSNNHGVLYINMEEFSGLGHLLQREQKGDLADLLYYFKQSPRMLSVKLQAIVGKFHGFDFISPISYCDDLRNIKSRDWNELIDAVSREDYDYIILDLSNMISDIFAILGQCDYVYMPVCNDKISMSKLDEYETYLFQTGREEIIEKTNKIKLPLIVLFLLLDFIAFLSKIFLLLLFTKGLFILF